MLSDSISDQAYLFAVKGFGQFMVAPFLFYSGFGIMESTRKKPQYFKHFPRNSESPYLFALISIPTVLVSAHLFNGLLAKADSIFGF